MNNNISLKSIKYESIKAIFTSIADAEKISRAAISELTNLSLVTVGKIADALLELNIISQIKEIRPQAGRRAGLLSVNEGKFTVILDLTSRDFHYAILNLRLSLIEHSMYTHNPDLSYEENLRNFLSEISDLLRQKYNFADCYGIGAAIPGAYNAATGTIRTRRIPELCGLVLKDLISEYFPACTVLIESHINAAAKSNVRRVEDYDAKNVIYYYIRPRFICGVYIVNGELVLGRDNHACDFGYIMEADGITLEERLAKCKTAEEYLPVLARSLYNLSRSFNPHEIIVECDLPIQLEDPIAAVREEILSHYPITEEDLPTMRRARCKFRNSHRGLAIGLREIWLESLVFAKY